MRIRVRVLPFMLVAILSSACSSPSAPTDVCVVGLVETCAPLYEPTFDNLYAKTLHPTCAQSGASCHSAEGAQAGLVYENVDTAYELLVGQTGRPRVTPGDPACSLLVERIDSTDPSQQMPPGTPLGGPERCGFEQWIREGAKR